MSTKLRCGEAEATVISASTSYAGPTNSFTHVEAELSEQIGGIEAWAVVSKKSQLLDCVVRKCS